MNTYIDTVHLRYVFRPVKIIKLRYSIQRVDCQYSLNYVFKIFVSRLLKFIGTLLIVIYGTCEKSVSLLSEWKDLSTRREPSA